MITITNTSILDSTYPSPESPTVLESEAESEQNSNDDEGRPEEAKFSPSSSSSMRKLCRVCGDKAFSVNFNVVTCESCKAFFRRNALKPKEFRCALNGRCQISVVTRRQCKKCRLEKCFHVGMVKDFIMSDEARMRKRHLIEENRAKRRMVIEKKLFHHQHSDQHQFDLDDHESVDDLRIGRIRIKRESCEANGDLPCSFDCSNSGIHDQFPPRAFNPTTSNRHHDHHHRLASTSSTVVSSLSTSATPRHSNSVSPSTELAINRISEINRNSSSDSINVPKSVLKALINQCHKIRPESDPTSSTMAQCPHLTSMGWSTSTSSKNPMKCMCRCSCGAIDQSIRTWSSMIDYEPGDHGHDGGDTHRAASHQSTSWNPSSLVHLSGHIDQPRCGHIDLDPIGKPSTAERFLPSSDADNHCRQLNIEYDDEVFDASGTSHVAASAVTTRIPTEHLKKVLYAAVGLDRNTTDQADGHMMLDLGIAPVKSIHFDQLRFAFDVLYDGVWKGGHTATDWYRNLDASSSSKESSDAARDVASNRRPVRILPMLTYLERYDNIIRRLVKLCHRIIALKYIDVEDQITLIKGSLMELIALRALHAYIPSIDCWRHTDPMGEPTPAHILKVKSDEAYTAFHEFHASFAQTFLHDDNVFLSIIALVLFSPDRSGLIDKDRIRSIRDFYYDMLHQYLVTTYCENTARDMLADLTRTLDLLPGYAQKFGWQIVVELDSSGREPLLVDIFKYSRL